MNNHLSEKARYWQNNFKYALAQESLLKGPIPIIHGCDKVPQCLVSITDFKKIHWPGAFVQSFKDDYKFDTRNGVWQNTKGIIEKLKEHKMGMLTPDFSVFSDCHPEICRWNFFRSRMVGYELESEGIDVIPTLTWWDDESVILATKELDSNKTYAVSTLNAIRTKEDKKIYSDRIRRICDILTPRVLLVYGSARGIDWGGQCIKEYGNGTYNWTYRNVV